MENILYPLLSLIPALINVGILVYLLFFVPKEKTTDIFSFFVLALILWQAEDTIMRLCATAETAVFWDRLLCIGWIGFAPIAFHFACRYTFLKSFYTRFSLVFIYLPFVLFYVLYIANSNPTVSIHQKGWGWIIMPRAGTLDGIQRLFISAYVIGAVFILFRYAFKMRNNKQKRLQALFIASGMFIPAVQGIITQIIYPVILNKPDIPVTSTFMTLFSVATILSMRKYRLFNISESVNVETVLANLKNIVFVVSPEQQIIYMNPHALEVFGMQTPDYVGTGMNTIFPGPSYYSAFATKVLEPSLKKKPIRNYATVFLTPLGNKIDVLLSAELITSNKQAQGLLVVANDVTELIRTLRDLETTNKELERFAYVASHDLQEPLRKMSNFLQLLQMKYKDKIDETATTYINTAVKCASQMRKLIQDLLEYSHIAAKRENLGTTHMNDVVEKVTQTLALQIEESGAQITSGPLPVLHRTDESQMQQVIQNLV
ncbi:MAG TPA: histidine kinase N-terminal 7TM domain-containing protein, partial [Chitinophagaceae bacterium]|nr:histidine kinase N-terminal 7TM domain-containing protein [Chitinophagaceae bacterium]